MNRSIAAAFLLVSVFALPTVLGADGEAFEAIFDGETLEGWESPRMEFWSVEDGAITATATPDHQPETNDFLVWQGGEVGDFELRLQIRIDGVDHANTGIQFRSSLDENGHAVGYQADFDKSGTFVGAIYDEHGRAMLAERGQRTVIDRDGERHVEQFADAAELMEHVNPGEWNDYHVVAVGPHMVIRINGHVMSEVTDLDEENMDRRGIIALQLHAGAAPMTVQFRNIRLRHLDGAQ